MQMRTILPLQQLTGAVQAMFECGDWQTDAEHRYYYLQAETAIENFYIALDECMVSIKNDDILHRYIRHCQHRIAALADMLPVSYMQSLQDPRAEDYNPYPDMKLDICVQLLQLLRHMYTDYHDYFIHDRIIPLTYREHERKDMETECMIIHTWLQYAEPEVIPMKMMILDMFSELQAETVNTLTYQQIDYIGLFVDMMMDLWKTGAEILCADDLRNYLLCMNFNTPEFFRYMQRHIQAILALCEDDVDRLHTIGNILNDLEEQVIVPDMAFNSKEKPINKMLVEWLIKEALSE